MAIKKQSYWWKKKNQIKENIPATRKVQFKNKEHINKQKLAEVGTPAYLAKEEEKALF